MKNTKRWLMLAAKLAVTATILILIFRAVLERESADELWARVENLSWGWVALAALAQLSAIVAAVFRWDGLLEGQGIRAPMRHLAGSFMIGRFFGALSPGGFTGLNGYRLLEIAYHTGKTARSTASIGVEMLCGKLGFASVIMVGSIFGLRYLGVAGVVGLNAFFLCIIALAGGLLARPQLIRHVSRALLGAVPTKVQSLVEAVCAYQGQGRLIARTVLLSAAVHAFNNLIYVAAARSLGLELGIGEVFFVSSVQIFATLMPISINGVGLREAAAVGLYTIVGVPAALAVLVPIVGFTVEMAISSFGGLILLSRRAGYHPEIEVENPELEGELAKELEHVEVELPRSGRGLVLGLSAGLLAGLVVGVSEGLVVIFSGSSAPDLGVLWYGAIAYGLLLGLGGAVGGLGLAFVGRLIHRQALPEPKAFGRLFASMTAVVALALGAFMVRRDIFHEELVWKSKEGLLVLLGCVAAAAVLYLLLSTVARFVASRRVGSFLLRAWGVPVLALVVVAGLFGAAKAMPPEVAAVDLSARPAPPARAGNVLFIVVDTLRADHLPSYGYQDGHTPSLDAFAHDSIRFEHAFSNASWTRPSFASILTSRFPASHRVMSKADALPDELETMPEAFAAGGYRTTGFVTNYNIAPYFNFQQGFDQYDYLEPEFVLGANDAAAKLLFVQVLKLAVERFSEAHPGAAYRDAESMNHEVMSWLDGHTGQDAADNDRPFFLFAAYMDPHDPYFAHPYEGAGFSRATHQHPDPDSAPELRQLYDGEVSYWDENFGHLIEDLKRRGLYDNMTIVITADHGEEFMEHGGFWHGTTLYDEMVHVPLFVKLPFNEAGGTAVSHWVQSVDLMPTLLTRAGLPAVDGVQGGDLFTGSDEVYAEESQEGNVMTALRTRRGLSQLKVIEVNAGNPRGLPTHSLFRVDQDPGEAVNLWDERPEISAIADGRLGAWHERAGQGAVQRRTVDTNNPEEVARLRALGYAGGEGPPTPPALPTDAAPDSTEAAPN